jgi:DNA mismatch repair protein MutS2
MARGRSRRGRPAGVDPPPDATLNLRGCTVVEAGARLLGFLDEAGRSKHRRLKVIHGKGTQSREGHSVVREAITARLESLRAEGRIRDFRRGNMGEGGSGVTIIWL